MVIDVGYSIGKHLKECLPTIVHTKLLTGVEEVEFKRVESLWKFKGNARFEYRDNIVYTIPECAALDIITRWFGIKSIVFRTYIDSPSKLIEPEGYETGILGTTVVDKGGKLVYGISGYK